MKINQIIIIIVNLVLSVQLMGQETINEIQAGNDFYKQKNFEQAEVQYNKAISKEPSNNTANFNLANTLYRCNKQDDAIKKLDVLVANEKEENLRSKEYYNKGVILSAQKKLEESIEAYKNTLRLNPADKDARENLQKALLELKKKNPPKKKEDKKKQEKKQQQPKMNQKEALQRLKLLEQKEKEVQQRMQKEKSKTGGGQVKDW